MATGWAKDGAVQEQIDASVDDAVRRAREALGDGTSLVECEDCGNEIPIARREALKGVRRCIGCQEVVDANDKTTGGINRRGSKDSQLR